VSVKWRRGGAKRTGAKQLRLVLLFFAKSRRAAKQSYSEKRSMID